MAVEAAARRSGVGKALCEAVAEWCREQGASGLELEVRAGSEGAIALYRGWDSWLWGGVGGITGGRWRMRC